MSELLPCPFCGGKSKLAMFGLFYCPDCGATICIENWNARMQAQEIVLDAASLSNTFSLSDTLSIQGETYRRESTCHNTQSDFDFMCSECGECVDSGRIMGFNYCPSCGAKVVD